MDDTSSGSVGELAVESLHASQWLEFDLAIELLQRETEPERPAKESAIVEALLACLLASDADAHLADIEFYHPLGTDAGRDATVLLQVVEPFGLELRSRGPASAFGRWTLHAMGRAEAAGQKPCAAAPTPSHPLSPGSGVHRDLTALGIVSDDPDHLVARVGIGVENGPGGLFATLRPRLAPEGICIAPEALEVALNLAAYLAGHRSFEGRLSRIASVWASEAPGPIAHVSVVPDAGDAWSVSLTDASGAMVVQLRGLRFEQAGERHERLVAAYLARMADIAAQVLPAGTAVDADANLLSFGMTSLDAVRLASALDARFGSAPPLDRVLASPTLRSIAEHYARGDDGREPREARFVRPASSSAGDHSFSGAVSSAEQRLWYLERHGEVGAAYNEAAAWQLDGPFDRAAFERCIHAISARHEVLRTAFVESAGTLSRKLIPGVQPALRQLDLRRDPPSSQALESLLLELVCEPFELSRAPLMRVTTIRIGEDRHVVLVVAHHIICDGWSLRGVISRELERLYRNAIGRYYDDALTPALQMEEYAAWERGLPADHQASLIDWWAKELDGFPLFLDLSLDWPRPSHQKHRGAHQRVEVPENLAHEVRAFARRLGVTPFVVLLAAYQLLLHRYSGQERFVLGVPCSLRQGPVLESLVGCLVNTVPIAASLAPEHSLVEVVRATHQRVARALERRSAPLERLVARLGCERDASHTALTQVAFSFDEGAVGQLDLAGCPAARIDLQPAISKFDLMLQVSDEGGPLLARFEYNCDIFDARRIEAMSRHYIAILGQLLVDASVPVAGAWFTSATPGDSRRFGRGASMAIADFDVRGSIDARLLQLGETPAIVDRDRPTSYAQLSDAVDRIAAQLRSQLGPDDALVAIAVGRSIEWVAAILASLRVGRGYMPIDPQLPALRAIALLEQAGVKALLHAGDECSWRNEFSGVGIDIYAVGAPACALPRTPVDPSAPFWAITTSGSTGAPKTAAVNHGGVANLLDWYSRLLEVTSADRVLVVTSIAFDLTQKNLFVALMNGARIVLDGGAVFDPREIRALIEKEGVTIINCTPTMLYALVERCGEAGWRQLRSLRAAVVGGEPVDMARLRPWLRADDCAARLINSYGPTECTDVCAAAEIAPDSAGDDAPIGEAIPNVDLYVLDRARAEVPVGVPGELYIGGVGIGRYLGSGGSGRFVSLADGRSLYATGDIVRFGWDGQLTFIGRADSQTKIRGHRVSPLEVEAAIRAHPAISDAAVIAADDGTGVGLHAYFVTSGELSASRLRSWLIERLPRFMIPSTLAPIAHLPLTPSGKIDRKALPIPERARGAGLGRALEADLLALWRELLQVRDLDPTSDFFASGGHSMLAISAADAIEARFGIRCRVLDVFERPTVRLMAELVASAQAS